MLDPHSLCNVETLSDRDLMGRCQRALFTSARVRWHGPRAELRRRIRQLLREHKHDRAWLYSTLRGVAASAAFALALIGLEPRTAQAAEPEFSLSMSAIGGFDVGSSSSPAFADLDGDGDADMLSGEYGGTLFYYENTGSPTSATFTARVGGANPLDGLGVAYNSAPAFADLDDDGDSDLLVGADDGTLAYFENTGTALSPTFVARTGAANPLNGHSATGYASPTFSDLDDDGDLDLVVGESSGAMLYFENTGDAASPTFVARTGGSNPMDGLSTGSYSAPALADLDEDGDLDLVAGEYDGTFRYYENIGSSLSPVFIERTGTANPLDGLDVGYNSTPAFVDLDADADLDIVAGEYDGTLRLAENTTPISNALFVEQIGASNPFDGANTSGYAAPVFADLDNDGDLDVVSGSYYGDFRYFENTGSATNPTFTERVGLANPFDGFDVGYSSSPAIVDMDGDGDYDLVSGLYYGTFSYFENIGTVTVPAFIERLAGANPLDGLSAGYWSTPTFVDLDNDGDFDLVSGEGSYAGTFLYFENTGTTTIPSFVERTGASNPLDGFSVGGFSTPEFIDFDGDGDLDLVSGEDTGTVFYFENTGSAEVAAFTEALGAGNPFFGLHALGGSSTPTLADLDLDGDLDLILGETTGTIQYFANSTGVPAVPSGGFWARLLIALGIIGGAKQQLRSTARRDPDHV